MGATLDARGCSRHFDVAFGGTLRLEHVSLVNGAGHASGGAVKVRHGGRLVATDSRFEDSKVVSLDGEAYGGAIDASNRAEIDKVLEYNAAHSDYINGVAFSADGTRIVTVGSDNVLRVWDAAPQGTDCIDCGPRIESFLLEHIYAHGGWSQNGQLHSIKSVAISPRPVHHLFGSHRYSLTESWLIVTVGSDGALRVWDLHAPAWALCSDFCGLSSDGRCDDGGPGAEGSFCSLGYDCVDCGNRMSMLQLGSSQNNAHNGNINDVAFSPDGWSIATVGDDGALRLWTTFFYGSPWRDRDLESPLHEKLAAHSGSITSVAFSPDGLWLATVGSDSVLRVWSTKDANFACGLRLHLEKFNAHSSRITCVAFAPDSARIATVGDDGTLSLWEGDRRWAEYVDPTHTGPCTILGISCADALAMSHALAMSQLLQLRHTRLNAHGGYRITSVALSATGSSVVPCPHTSDGTCDDGGPGAEWSSCDLGTDVVDCGGASDQRGSGGVRIVTVGDDNALRVWDANDLTMPLLSKLNAHSSSATAVAIAPDGTRIATGGHSLRVWDDSSDLSSPVREKLDAGNFIRAVAFSARQVGSTRYNLIATADNGGLRVWDSDSDFTRPLAANLTAHSYFINAVAFSPDGSRIVTVGGDYIQTYFGPAPDGDLVHNAGQSALRVWDSLSLSAPLAVHLNAQRYFINSVAFSPDGLHIATVDTGKNFALGSDWGKALRIWDANSNLASPLFTLHGAHNRASGYGINSVAYSPDGSRIASASSGRRCGGLNVWDATSNLSAWSGSTSLCYNGCAPLSYNGCAHRHGGLYTLAITAVTFSPDDGTRLATVGDDSTLRVWDATSDLSSPLLEKLDAHGDSAIRSVAYSPCGTRLATVGDDYALRVWDANDLSLVIEKLNAHSRHINSVAFSPGGLHIATVGDDEALRVWPMTFLHTQLPPRVSLAATTIERCTAVGQTRASGGGLSLQAGEHSLVNSTIAACEATLSSSASPLCSDACQYSSAYNNSVCEDGGVGSDYDSCSFGFDCTDCGPRLPPSPPGTAPPAPASGGGMFVRQATFAIEGTVLVDNNATKGAALAYESGPTFDATSTVSGTRFEGNVGESTVLFSAAITWACNPGNWSQIVGQLSGDFDACARRCAAGTVWTAPSHTEPTCGGPCPVGSFCPAGTVLPTPCPAGYRMPATGAGSQSSCIPCSPGSHQPVAGEAGCVACPPGTFTDELNATACTACPAGGFCAAAGAASALVFQVCPAGTYNPDRGTSSAAACHACPVGNASAVPGMATADACRECPPGSYASSIGTAVCTRCLAGSYQDAEGAAACKACEPGSYCPAGASAPLPCTAGSYSSATNLQSATECSAAEPGHFAPTGSIGQTPCAAGTAASSAGAGACAPCAAGSYQDATGASACVACPAGSYCPTGAAVALRCDEGQYQDGRSQSGCVACPAGFACAAGAAAPVECIAGQQANAPASASLCELCPVGSYQDQTQQTSCLLCPAGAECSRGSAQASSCSAGMHSHEGQGTCTKCALGTFQSEEGATACRACEAGSYCPEGASAPRFCEAGSYGTATNLSSAADCTLADVGFYAPAGSAAQSVCLAGTYSDMPGMGECRSCPGGTYRPGSGLATTGRDSEFDGRADPGSGDAAGSGEQLTADPNSTLASAAELTRCRACEPGSYCPPGASAPLPCREGSYSSATNLTRASECMTTDPGFYAPTGSVEQIACAAGNVAPGDGSSTCTACSAGSFQRFGGQTACEVCPSKSYCPEGTATPVVCPPGTANPTEGAEKRDACVACAAGFWCGGGDSVPCVKDTFNPVASNASTDQSACSSCPANSTTMEQENATSITACRCNRDFFNANASQGGVQCEMCPSGTSCGQGTTLDALPIKRGYYRTSARSIDVRRCPDAATNCSSAPECGASTSGCRGSTEAGVVEAAAVAEGSRRLEASSEIAISGESAISSGRVAVASLCHEGLAGVYCLKCDRSNRSATARVYYSAATESARAACHPCAETLVKTLLVLCGLALAAAVGAPILKKLFFALGPLLLSPRRERQLRAAWKVFKPLNKVKILAGFYMIATKVGSVYEVELPGQVRIATDCHRVATDCH